MALEHLGLGRQRKGHPFVEHEPQLRVGEVVAVHDVVVVTEQAVNGETIPAVGHARGGAGAVHAGDEAKLTRELEVIDGDIIG